MAAVGEGADGKSVNGALLGGELFGFATRNGFGALLEFVASLLTIPRVVEDGGVEHVLPIGFSDFLLIVLELFFILAIGIEAKGDVDAKGGARFIVFFLLFTQKRADSPVDFGGDV